AVVCAAAVLAAGCQRGAPDEERSTAEHAEHPPARINRPGMLQVAPEMLRDLRVTTAPAESRPSGEGVTALGELRVVEDAFAEIGSPIEARVVRVFVGVGDTVVDGQPLVQVRSVELGKARADYLRARAQAELAEQTLRRARSLAGERIVPARELQAAEAAARAAAAELAAAETRLQALGGDDTEAAGAEVLF